MENKDFIEVHTIVCPECKRKQTGIVRESPGVVVLLGTVGQVINIPFGTYYIRCSNYWCEHIIQNDQLEECTRPIIQFPSQINKPKYLTHENSN